MPVTTFNRGCFYVILFKAVHNQGYGGLFAISLMPVVGGRVTYSGMDKVFNKKLKILFAVTAILLVSTVGLYAFNYLKQTPSQAPTTTTADDSLTTPTSTEPFSSELTTTLETTMPETTTTEETTTLFESPHHFSHLTIFLDVQRAVFFHTTPEGEQIPEVSLRISTGRVKGSTPVTPPDKPFILSGYRAPQLLFTKAATWVWVRYATHVSGDIFIHSQPYDHQKDANGKTLPLDRSLFSKWGYNRLGLHTASNGCIRLCLRDAKYLSDNIHRGMPCYIFESSEGIELPEAPSLPPANLNNRWDPTDTDPLSPYVHRQQNSMAWKYVPKGKDIEVLKGLQPSAADGVSNGAKLPSGTTFSFKMKPVTDTPGEFSNKVTIKYPDKSVEEVSVKILVIDPATTTTPTTTTAPVTTTDNPTTATTSHEATTDPPEVTTTTTTVAP